MLIRFAPGRYIYSWSFIQCLIVIIEATGVLEIRFEQFQVDYIIPTPGNTNPATTVRPGNVPVLPRGNNITAPNGPSWDGPPTCRPPARYRFFLCVDFLGQPERCQLGAVETDLVQIIQGITSPRGGRDTIMFGNRLRTRPTMLRNPIRYSIRTWPGSVQVNVYVQCCGVPETRHCEEKLSGKLSASPVLDRGIIRATVSEIASQGRLFLSATIVCNENYFGPNCTSFCRDDNPQDNIVCHPSTGELVCSPGWTGRICTDDVDECDLGVCLHGAACINVIGTFTCHCLRGSSGRFCEYRTPTCRSGPCRNAGTCEEDLDTVGFRCQCPVGWTGVQCATPVPVTTGVAKTQKAPSVTLEEDMQASPEEHGHAWTIWYVGISLLALTCIVVIFLIVCVIWSTRRRRYMINEVAKLERPVATATNSQQFDNAVYLNDPEHLNLEPPTSNLYQRRLISDDPYMNEAALYQDRIYPDSPYEPIDRGRCCSRDRPESPDSNNVYTAWDHLKQPEEEPYEPVDLAAPRKRADQGDNPGQEGASNIEPTTEKYSDTEEFRDEVADTPYATYDFLHQREYSHSSRRWSTFTNTSDLPRTESVIYDVKLPEENESCSSSTSSEYVISDKYNVNGPVYDDDHVPGEATRGQTRYLAMGVFQPTCSDAEQPIYETHIPYGTLERSDQNEFTTEPIVANSETSGVDRDSEPIYEKRIPYATLERSDENHVVTESRDEASSSECDSEPLYEIAYEENSLRGDSGVSDRSGVGTEPILSPDEGSDVDSDSAPVYEMPYEEHDPLDAGEVNDRRKSTGEAVLPANESSDIDSDSEPVYELVYEENDQNQNSTKLSSRTSETDLMEESDSDPVYDLVFGEDDAEHIYQNHVAIESFPKTNKIYMLDSIGEPGCEKRMSDSDQFATETIESVGDASEFDSDTEPVYDTLSEENIPCPDTELSDRDQCEPEAVSPIRDASEIDSDSEPVYDTLSNEDIPLAETEQADWNPFVPEQIPPSGEAAEIDRHSHVTELSDEDTGLPDYANSGLVSDDTHEAMGDRIASPTCKRPFPSPRITRARLGDHSDIGTPGESATVDTPGQSHGLLKSTGSLTNDWPAENSNKKSCSYDFNS